jgi:hypothetical protein
VGNGPFKRSGFLRLFFAKLWVAVPLFVVFAPHSAFAQIQEQEDEIVTSLTGGRVILHVAKDDAIFFAAIDQPVEQGAAPPRLVDIDGQHIGILFGASEWRAPADPKPIRMDRNIERIASRDKRFEGTYGGEADPDLEIMGTAFLEKLRPLAAQLRKKLDFPADQPIFEMIVIGYGPKGYGPEAWTVEYRITQELLTTRDNYWQTRVLRPRFTQIYPPEKHAPKVIVEASYPADDKPTLQTLLEGNDPRFSVFRNDQKMAKALDLITKGQAQKVDVNQAEQFLRAAVPLLYPKQNFFIGKMDGLRGFDWIVPPEEPIEKVEKKNDKNQPPEAPTLRKKPTPQ